MKKLIIALIALAQLTVSLGAHSAVTQYRMTWDALPADQTVVGQCQINNGEFTEVGRAAGNASIDFSVDVNPGDTVTCRAFSTKIGFANSANSGVAISIVPLAPPTGLRVQAVQP